MALVDATRFKLVRKLGEGGMGVVYEAHDRERDARVALKILRNVTARSLYRFKREFRTLSDVSHPNIVALYELISEGEEWAFTMELIEGCDFLEYVRGKQGTTGLAGALFAYLDHSGTTASTQTSLSIRSIDDISDSFLPRNGSGLPTPPLVRPRLAEIVDLERLRLTIRQIARALYFLHSVSIIHRDLKPSNVRVTPDGRAVLMDFGVAAELSQPIDLDLARTRSGTPSFMAPEQVTGDPPTAAADWYSFGVMLYVALTGRRPYEGTQNEIMAAKRRSDPLSPSRFVQEIPSDLEALCARLLVRDASARMTGPQVLEAMGLDSSPVRRTAETTLDTGAVVFVGRARELAYLHEIHARADAGDTQCVVIRGPSGIGKTCLVNRFLEQLESDPNAEEQMSLNTLLQRTETATSTSTPVLLGRCHERETMAYKAIDGIIDGLSHRLLTLPEDQREELTPPSFGALVRLFPTLSRVSGCKNAMQSAFETSDPSELRKHAVASLRAWLSQLATESPVIIAIRDLQWADRESLELLAGLLAPPQEGGKGPELMVVITVGAREEDGSADAKLARIAEAVSEEQWHRIELGPLLQNEQQELLRSVTPHHAQAGVNDQLWQEAAGHPMLLTELARFLQEAPGQRDGLQHMQLNGVIWRRIICLPKVPKELTELLAVAGEPIPLSVLGEAAQLRGGVRERAAAVLRIARLARKISRSKDEQWVDVYHNKVREAVISHLSQERVQELHGQLARALEARGQARGALLAHHWLRAGAGQRAAPYLIELARFEAEQLAIDSAIARYRAALDHLPTSPHDPELDALRRAAEAELAQCLRIKQE